MKQRLPPETVVVIVSLLFAGLVMVLFAINLVHAHGRDSDQAAKRVHHFSMMVAENTARAFEVVEVLLREAGTDLARTDDDWTRWTEGQAWEYLARRDNRSLGVTRSLNLFLDDGTLKASSDRYPLRRLNPGAAEFLDGARGSALPIHFGPFLAGGAPVYVYGMALALPATPRRPGGFLAAEIDPMYMQEFCWPGRLSEDFEAVLVNARQQVVASCRPADVSARSPLLGNPATQALFKGERPLALDEIGVHVADDYVVSVARVPGFGDLRVVTVVPARQLLQTWFERRDELLVMAGLIVLFILISGWLLRRHLRSSAAVTRHLAEQQGELAAQIDVATRELREQRNMADRANQAKSRFLAAASHDLRQPLHALSLFAADLLHQVRRGESVALPHLAEQISGSTRLIGEMLDALLDLSRLDVQGVHPEISSFPLQGVFDRLLTAQSRAAEERQIDLRFRLTPFWVHTDPVMLARMIGNLVANAVRYAPEGGRVLVLARRRAGKVRVEVRDNGSGIPREHQEAIFAEFYQVGNAAREQGKGLGLGLSIVDRLARALQIEIGLRSRPGRGTTFSLLVEAAAVPALPTVLPLAVDEVAAIFVVGEDPALDEAVRLLSDWTYPVVRYASVAALVDSGLPQLGWLIAPVALGRALDGLGVLRLPLILIGDAAEVAAGLPGLRNRAQYLARPLRPAKLRALLRG